MWYCYFGGKGSILLYAQLLNFNKPFHSVLLFTLSINVYRLILQHKRQPMLSNNDILKKLRVALSLRNDDIIHILSLVDFEITKGALGDLFRNEDHPNYKVAGDQILRNFLNGLIIYKRGKKEDSPEVTE